LLVSRKPTSSPKISNAPTVALPKSSDGTRSYALRLRLFGVGVRVLAGAFLLLALPE
jgi:hypothetical protein